MLFKSILFKLYWTLLALVWGITYPALSQETNPQENLLTGQMLLERASEEGSVPIIIKLRLPTYTPEGILSSAAEVVDQRTTISSAQTRMLAELSPYDVKQVKQFKHLPLLAMHVDAIGLRALLADPQVEAVYEDKAVPPALADSTPLIGATTAWQQGFAGNGQVVAVLDTGVDKNHPFLTSKVVDEACFSTTNASQNSRTVCPNGQSRQIGVGAGIHCSYVNCAHGTHVAGIVAGRGNNFSGVARDASVMAVQVFSVFLNNQSCRQSYGEPNCVLSYISDQIAALEYVYAQRNRFSIAAINMSLGGGRYSSHCDTEPQKQAIDLLRSVNIATVIASGNSSYKDAIGSPACISSAISVGATDKQDRVASFSNSAQILDLLAPGVSINSSVPGSSFERFNGTSMAAPHVAGAFAVLRSKAPTASVNTLLNALLNTGVSITDSANGISKPRIKVDAALNALSTGGNGSLRVTPETGLTASGRVGGPFTPTSQTYQLTNPGSAAINFTVSESVGWASASPTSGSLDPGASANVVVSIDAGANTLAAGDYASAVSFTNTTNNVGSTSRPLSLSVTAPAITNDKFQDAILLTGNSGSTAGSNVGAGKETGEPNHGGQPGGRSVWWRWTAPSNGEAVFDTFNSNFDTLLGAYTGSSIAALTTVAGNDDDGGQQSRIRFQALANTTHYIAVDGYNSATGNITLHWQFTPNVNPSEGISVSPQTNFVASGPPNGPFTPASMTYTLTNVSAADVAFTVQGVPNWLTASPTSGALAPGESAGVTLSINATANSLQPGQYSSAVLFNSISRTVVLQVNSSGAANDNFSAARALNGTTAQDSGSNVGAGKEVGEPNHAGRLGGRSVWWRWTAPASDSVAIDTFGSNFDTLLGVYTGAQVSALTEVASSDDAGNGLQSQVSFRAVAGMTYYIAVDGYGAAAGGIVLNLAMTAGSGPSNNDFTNAAVLQGVNAAVTGGNQNADKEPGEPNHADSPGGHSVWWRWTAPAAGTTTIDTFGSNFDTLLGVYTGAQVSALTPVAANDDAGGGRQSRVSFQAVAGVAYYIAVDGWNGGVGDIVLNLNLTVTPGNDDFINGFLAQGTKVTVNGGNQNATKEVGEPNHVGASGGHSVWWRWTAPAAGTMVIDTFGSNFDTLLGVYAGARVTALTTVASNDDADGGTTQSRVSFPVVAGATYSIAVDGYNGATGAIVLNLELTLAQQPDNDLFANAARLQGMAATANGGNQNATKEEDEPNHAGNRGGHSVWWKWTAPVTGTMSITTFGSNFDTLLGVYQGSQVAELIEVASNDDAGGRQSQVAFPATAGAVYYIAVDGWDGSVGNIVLTLALEETYTLRVEKTGPGLVTSNLAGISCGGDCQEDYPSGAVVTLTATPNVNAAFTGWGGACSGLNSTCQVTMDQVRSVTAAFMLPYYPLTVAVTGLGAVSSSPAGVNCGGDCQEDYPSGAVVTLTASPNSNAVFTGWGGACSGLNPTCQVTMNQARSVTAAFNKKVTYSLKVAKRGNGSGVVSSSPAGVNCGSDCSESYVSGKVVKLTAKAKSDSTFAGWSGACSGTASTCTVTMSQAKTVTAAFVKKGYYLLTVSKAGSGGGSVTSSPAGIACGSDCDHSYRSGVKVKLTAKASSGSTFAGWSGSCSGRSLTCQITLSKTRAVKVTFNRRSAAGGYDWQELLAPEQALDPLPGWGEQ